MQLQSAWPSSSYRVYECVLSLTVSPELGSSRLVKKKKRGKKGEKKEKKNKAGNQTISSAINTPMPNQHCCDKSQGMIFSQSCTSKHSKPKAKGRELEHSLFI